jgi:twitching motility protein PilT
VNGTDCLKAFRSTDWTSEDEVRTFVEQVEGLEPADVTRMLQHLTSPGVAAAPGYGLRVMAFRLLAERVLDKGLFAHYVRALRSASPELRAALASLLPGVNSILDHPALCALISSPDASLRATVAGTLREIGAKTAFDMLSGMVHDPRLQGRREIMSVLAVIGEHRAVPALQAALSVGTQEERIYAIELLASPQCMARDANAAARAIATALADPAEGVTTRALGALAQITGEEDYFAYAARLFDSPAVGLVTAAVNGLRLFPSGRSVAVLHRKLREGPQVVRFASIEVLETIGTPDVLKPLAEALGHSQLVVRLRAAEALARLSIAGKLDLARTVVWLLRSRDTELRRLAVELAHSVKDPEGELWPKLLGCLRDEDWWVRERVADALLELAGPALLRHVVPYLQDAATVMRQFAVELLMRIKAPESLGALVRSATDDEDWWVRERAIDAIAVLKDPRSLPYLIDIMLRNPDLQVACLQALRTLGELAAAEAGPHVAELLGSPEADVRLAAVRCLGSFRDPQQAAALEPLLKDSSAAVRSLARDVLQELGPRREASSEPATDTLSFLDKLLVAMAQKGCDDLILSPGRQPHITRLGVVAPLAKNVLEGAQLGAMLARYLSPKHVRELDERREADFSYEIKEHRLRFRVNVFHQLGGLAAVFRIVKGAIPRVEELGLPPVVEALAALKNGLVLVGGPTGSGKSTTLAALIEHINRSSARHIVTFEDPIEVVHRYQRSLVNQREIHSHTNDLGQALRGTLREDPDVILIGEMRDLPTIAFAVSAAETGHLVFATIHTSSAGLTVDRIINAFPPGQHDQVRSLVAGSLKAVVCQYLVPRSDGPGRCLAVEVMLNSDAIANLIRKGKTFQIPSVIATSRELGMQLMDLELMRLLDAGRISPEDAYMRAVSKKEFEGRLVAEAPAASPETTRQGG